MSLLSEKIFYASDGGREIILDFYPQASQAFSKPKLAFKIRESETSASSRVKKTQSGVWIVTDFGDDMRGRNGIQVYMKEKGVDYTEALLDLAKKYGLTAEKPKAKVTFKTATNKDTPGYSFVYKEKISSLDLQILGPKVDEDLCKRYNLFSVDTMTFINDKGNKVITKSTEDYPIFVFDFGTWKKIYQPLHPEKKDRFRYSGTKPSNFVFGLEYAIEAQKEHEEDVKDDWDYDKKPDGPKKYDFKLDNITIASGDRDALNVASFDRNVVWLNSESDKLTYEVYQTLLKIAKNIYVLPDIDVTGKKQGVKLALDYSKIKIVWLPKWLAMRKDFRGKPRKDFLDFVQVSYYSNNEANFERLLDKMYKNAFPMRFWDETWQDKKRCYKYVFNNEYAMHFIEHIGFYRYESDQSKEDYEFIRVENNVVEKVKGHHIKKHLHDFLEKRNLPIDLRNMLHRTNQLSDKSLSVLNSTYLNFKKGYSDSQFLFFKDCVWKITKEGVKKLRSSDVKANVWKNDIIDYSPKVENDFFAIKKVDNGFDIAINNTNCMYLNYLINTSRVHWKKEIEAPFKTDEGYNTTAQKNYIAANKFNIAGPNLDQEQQWEQKQHLVNKIFAIGHLLHSYKDDIKSWFVWNMDYEVVEDLVSSGGTGKSLFFKMLMPILKNVKKIDGRERNVADKDFLFDGVTEQTDLILTEDMDAYFRFHRFLNGVTDDLSVNPKGQTAYTLKHELSPKFGGSSNFGVGNMDEAAMRRLLFVATGDYYHEKSEKHQESRQVSDDFNGKRLIRDFTDADWNQYYNFCAQCLKFYLSQSKRINPPMANIEKRNLVRSIKTPFITWASGYFSDGENLDMEVDKITAFESCKTDGQPKLTPQAFKKSLKNYCKLKGYVFNPEDYEGVKDGRIMRKIDGATKEFFFIKPNAEERTNTNSLFTETKNKDDLPF